MNIYINTERFKHSLIEEALQTHFLAGAQLHSSKLEL